MIGILDQQFMQNALAAGVLASLACGMIGTLVVVNRLVFLAGGIAHAAYGGVGLAFFLGLPVLPCTVGFTLLSSLAMGGFTLHRKERADTVIGVLWAAGMALGIILLDLSPGYNTDIMSYLFGSILTVRHADLWFMLGLDTAVLLVIVFFYKDFIAMSFDPEFARTRGIPVAGLYFLLLGMIAVSVVMIIQVVGLILVIALLTIPPWLAQRTAASLGRMMIAAVLWSVLFCLIGLFLAYMADLSSGASIIAIATVSFFGVFSWDSLRVRYRSKNT